MEPKAGDLYPWILHKAHGATKTVLTPDAKAQAEADGWTVEDPDQQPDDVARVPEADADDSRPANVAPKRRK